MERLYNQLIKQHFIDLDQMLFMAGPRQVGKSTISMTAKKTTNRFLILNWDNEKHRKIILRGEEAILAKLEFHQLAEEKPTLVFDEIHKYKDWKNYLKGFYDIYKGKINIIVCGSAKLDIYKKGGDSLMGRYILYRIHPFTLREIIKPEITENLINKPTKIDRKIYDDLLNLGGYPEPFLKKNQRFSNQWRRLRMQQLFREEIIELKQISELSLLEALAHILSEQSGGLTSYTNLAHAIKVSADTIKRWMTILESFYFCFKIQPWHKNVKRSLLKEPKVYLWDWTLVDDMGAKIENFVASHLLKAVHWWTDHGLGNFNLYYIRDKEQREVDFLVSRDNKPWFIVEVKTSNNKQLSPHLANFQRQTGAQHAFQVIHNLEHVEQDCFSHTEPIKVPMTTFLSQLV